VVQETIISTLENDMLYSVIKKRPNMFVGTNGPAGFENVILQTLDGLLSLFSDSNSGILQVELLQQQVVFSIVDNQPLQLKQEATTNHTPFLYMAILQALSEQLGISIESAGKREIYIYQQGAQKKRLTLPLKNKQHKIEIAFRPNRQFFGQTSLSYFKLFRRCQQLAMLNSGLTIHLTNGAEQRNTFFYQNGLTEYIFQQDESLTRGKYPLIFQAEQENIKLEAVISKNSCAHIADTFVNGHLPVGGGTHYDGFVEGIVAAINEYFEETKRLKYLTAENFAERFDFVVTIKMKQPRYAGVIRKKVRNPELYTIIKALTFNEVATFLRKYPTWHINERL
jgi:DNA gyrase subunit B